MPKLISANRLVDGIVVYLGLQKPWVEQMEAAAPLTSGPEVDAALDIARADVSDNYVVDPFVVDIKETTDGPVATTLRNAIRAKGPTVDFGARISRPTEPVSRS